MTWDPQNAPLDWTKILARALDTEGNWLVLVQNQDGEEWWDYEEEDR